MLGKWFESTVGNKKELSCDNNSLSHATSLDISYRLVCIRKNLFRKVRILPGQLSRVLGGVCRTLCTIWFACLVDHLHYWACSVFLCMSSPSSSARQCESVNYSIRFLSFSCSQNLWASIRASGGLSTSMQLCLCINILHRLWVQSNLSCCAQELKMLSMISGESRRYGHRSIKLSIKGPGPNGQLAKMHLGHNRAPEILRISCWAYHGLNDFNDRLIGFRCVSVLSIFQPLL